MRNGKATESRDAVLLSLGRRVRHLRILKGLTQKGLAQLVGTSQAHIFMVERGTQNVGVAYVVLIAQQLGVSPGALLEDNPSPSMPEDPLKQILSSYAALKRRLSRIERDLATRS